jgi:hypothetical protein
LADLNTIPIMPSFPRTLCLASFALLLSAQAAAKDTKDIWWTYLASYDKGPGSITVDLSLNKRAPLAAYPFVVITGIHYNTTRPDRMPETKDIESLNAFSEKTVAVLEHAGASIYAGRFIYQGEIMNYVYVKDTAKAESALREFYAKSCAVCKVSTHSKPDEAWGGYKDFLYPNQTTLDFYRNDLKKLGFVPD